MQSQPRCDLKKIGEVEAKVYGHMNHKGASKRWENLNVENPLQNFFKVQNKVLEITELNLFWNEPSRQNTRKIFPFRWHSKIPKVTKAKKRNMLKAEAAENKNKIANSLKNEKERNKAVNWNLKQLKENNPPSKVQCFVFRAFLTCNLGIMPKYVSYPS